MADAAKRMPSNGKLATPQTRSVSSGRLHRGFSEQLAEVFRPAQMLCFGLLVKAFLP
jgi:hypothetical protein